MDHPNIEASLILVDIRVPFIPDWWMLMDELLKIKQ